MNLPINTTSDGTAFAVTTRSAAGAFENVSQGGGGHYPSTGVIVIYEVADNYIC